MACCCWAFRLATKDEPDMAVGSNDALMAASLRWGGERMV